ncbi:alpha/beta hydrolase [Plantactinospora mayteni]|uniref:Chloroperoxidase n=1 Tax=Plantactinospora mayteni TaxID=566021 RepID=A0ABQ4F020_9ACTN|nr:alpha/beta hydrolase [Plantactinospora mayteni]GIH00256.1 chloroperoxidase [Plantactinospora mayteni]
MSVSHVTIHDGTRIFFKDWGAGRPVVLSHGWPLNSDSWEAQQLFLAGCGYRVIAHDRRGHGRSTQTWHGNDLDTHADDLASLIDHLDLRDITLIGFATGAGEVARYIGRHGTARVAQAVLVSAVPPSPDDMPVEMIDRILSDFLADRSQLYRDLADGPFFGDNRPGADISQGIRDAFWLQSMTSGHRNAYQCLTALPATDLRADLGRFDVPTLIIHGNDDQIVPIDVGGRACATLVPHAELVVYPGAPHGLAHTHQHRLSLDLLAFLKKFND